MYATMRLALSGRFALLVCAFVLVACQRALPQREPLNVVTTLPLLADWARQVGGDRVRVEAIVPPGANPRTYRPSPDQRAAIQTADVVILNGLGLEPWIEPILNEAPDAPIVVLEVSQFVGPTAERGSSRSRPIPDEPRAGIGSGLRPGQEQAVPGPIFSPYLWLDPRSAIGQVDLIAQTLTRADPDGIVVYRQNAARYGGELENLDSNIQRQIDSWKWRSLLATDRFLHPFARRYTLPLHVLNDTLRTRATPPDQPLLVDLFAPSPQERSIRGLRRPIVVLNPLGGQTYIELMQTNVQSMTMALAGKSSR